MTRRQKGHGSWERQVSKIRRSYQGYRDVTVVGGETFRLWRPYCRVRVIFGYVDSVGSTSRGVLGITDMSNKDV